MDGQAIAAWIASCRKPGGGYGGSPRNDAHLLYTLSALQGLALLGRLDEADADATAACEAAHRGKGGGSWHSSSHVCGAEREG